MRWPGALTALFGLQHHYPKPACVLRIRLVEARDLPAADLSLFSPRSSDPYCKISVGTTGARAKGRAASRVSLA
jgi:hypothetical protein